jgi:putative membrane protein
VSIGSLPTLNVLLNITSAVLLIIGYIIIKRRRPDIHKRIMLAALFSSIIFLTSYLIYHFQVGSVPYLRHDWTRSLYFAILIPHVILAGLVGPFILLALWFALSDKFDRHKKLARWVWPVWLFVCVSGIAVYFMLYQM